MIRIASSIIRAMGAHTSISLAGQYAKPRRSHIEKSRDSVKHGKTDSLVCFFKLFVVLALLLWFGRDFRGGRPPTPLHPSPTD
jgi:hypothetical protein